MAKVKMKGGDKKLTLPTVTVTGTRKKEVAKSIPTKGKKTFAVAWKSGDTTQMSEAEMKKVMYKKD